MTDPASFKNAKGWYTQLKMMGEQGVQVALVGNKADLDNRQVPEEEANEFAQQVPFPVDPIPFLTPGSHCSPN